MNVGQPALSPKGRWFKSGRGDNCRAEMPCTFFSLRGFEPLVYFPQPISFYSPDFPKEFMKRLVLILLLLASCVAQPYVQPGTNQSEKVVEKVVVQCWDGSTAVSAEACPPKEEKVEEKKTPAKVIVETLPPSVPIARKYLEDAQKTFTSYAYPLSDRMVIISGDKVRHYFYRLGALDDKTPITDVYVDGNKATAYCDIEHEKSMYGDSFDLGRSQCKNYINKALPQPVDKWLPDGPLQYLEKFADKEPILVEDNVQTINIGGNSKTIQPSLHYMVDGKRVVLRLDKRYHVPLRIEIEGERAIDFRDTYYDTMVLEGRPTKIDQSWFAYKPVSDYWTKQNSK